MFLEVSDWWTLIQQIFVEHLLSVRNYTRWWRKAELIIDEKVEEAGSMPELLMIRRKKKRNQKISQSSRSWSDCVPGSLACPYLLL